MGNKIHIEYLQKLIEQKRKTINEYQIISCRTNICDRLGISPIDKLLNEIKIIQEIIEMVKTNPNELNLKP